MERSRRVHELGPAKEHPPLHVHPGAAGQRQQGAQQVRRSPARARRGHVQHARARHARRAAAVSRSTASTPHAGA